MNNGQQIGRTEGVIGYATASAAAHCGQVTGGCAEADRQFDQTVRVSVDIRATRNFSDALMAAMDGLRVTRAGWNASGQYVSAQYPDKGSKMSRPYLFLKNAQNDLVPWVPSQGDLFANDWAFLPR